MRRFATIALSLSLVLGLSAAGRLLAQDEKTETKPAATPDASKAQDAPKADEAKKDESKKDESKKDDTKKDEAKKDEAKKDEAKKDETKAAEPAPPSIPPEVEAKLEAARRAVAEAIVAAQDAGLVNTSIDPPPILDILITGRADDAAVLKAALDNKENPEAGVSPEVFGAWFTNFGKMAGVTTKIVRIVPPDKGLTDWYRSRAAVLNRHLDAVRKAKGDAPKAETKAETPKAETPKDETKKDETKKDETKKDETPK